MKHSFYEWNGENYDSGIWGFFGDLSLQTWTEDGHMQWLGEDSPLNGSLEKKNFYYGFNIICKQITSIFFFSQSLFIMLIMLIFSSCQDVFGHYKPYTFIKTTTSKRKLRMICKIEFIIFRRMMNLTSFHVVCVSHTFKI